MIPSRLHRLETELRRAAASRRYAETARLAAQLGEAVANFAAALPKGDPRAREAARGFAEATSWALLMLKAARANCLAEYRRVSAANRYTRRTGEANRPAAVRLEA
ncbi:MAG TPA: hypothetical protein VMU19_08875 [Bryobacteraceae bacterium]|nr:hypothetical protein [Bryobacteraceae bacterium]